MNHLPEICNILANSVRRLPQINSRCCLLHRALSSKTNKDITDPLPVYLNEKVQSLLTQITTIDLAKIARLRMANTTETPQFKLMGKTELQELEDRMLRNICHQVIKNRPPVMRPRKMREKVLQENPELAPIMDAKYVFVDISKDDNTNDKDKWIVVRDKEGLLRMASHDEQERMSQMFYPQEGRRLVVPSMLQGGDLEIMLNNQKHAYVLERACVQYEPDDERYIELTSKVYEHVNRTQQFDLLRSTRHFGPMAFYLTWHDKIDLLLADMLERNLLLDAEDLVKLYCIVHGKTVPNVQKLDLIKDYLTNHSHKDTMPHLELSVQSYEDKNKDGEPVINIENRQLLQKVINAGGL